VAYVTKLTSLAARGMLDNLTARCSGGTIKVYTGTRPASADDELPAGGILILAYDLPTPCFPASVDGNPNAVATANVLGASVAEDSGVATWFRVESSASVPVMDGNVGTTDADLILESTTIANGQSVSISSWIITLPEG
jgi:hypothetical protein